MFGYVSFALALQFEHADSLGYRRRRPTRSANHDLPLQGLRRRRQTRRTVHQRSCCSRDPRSRSVCRATHRRLLRGHGIRRTRNVRANRTSAILDDPSRRQDLSHPAFRANDVDRTAQPALTQMTVVAQRSRTRVHRLVMQVRPGRTLVPRRRGHASNATWP
jgi:hypothetical protein